MTVDEYKPNVNFQYPQWVLPYIMKAVQGTNVTPEMILALLRQESGFDPKAVSPAGAQGIAQFMPATAKAYNVDVWDPDSSIRGAVSYLDQYYKQYNDWMKTLAAYNAGPGNVYRWQSIPQTKNYVQSIMGSIGQGSSQPQPQLGGSSSSAPSATLRSYYTVQPGDTLSKIALQHYGNASAYNKLSGYSSGNPNLIYPGEKIYYG